MDSIRNFILDNYPKIFARKYFWRFNQMLVDIGYRGLGILNWRNFKISGENFLTEYIQKNFSLKVIFDVGANQGDYAKKFLNTSAAIHCFEPDPLTFERLKNNLKNSDRVFFIQKGLSDKEGEGIIFDYIYAQGSSHSSLYKEVITDICKSTSKQQTIELTTIDNYIKQNQIEKINFLKIDTEGNEYKVLQGANQSILDNKIDIIQFEFNEMNAISRSYMRDFIQILPNYNLYRLLPKGLLPIKYIHPVRYEIFGFQNIVAIRKNIDINLTSVIITK